MAVLLQDSADRTSSTTDPNAPTTGGPYTTRVGTWGVITNQLYTSASVANSQLTFPAAFNVDFAADVPNSGGSGTSGAQLMIRWVDASNYWAWGRNGTGTIALMRCTAGTLTTMSPSISFTSGRLRVVGIGGLIQAYLDDVLKVQAYDYWMVGTEAGIRNVSNTTGRFDNLLAQDSGPLPGDGSTAFIYKGRDKRSSDQGGAA